MESDSYDVITGIIFVVFIIYMYTRKKSSTKKQGYKIFQQICRSNVDYLNGLIPDEYVEKYRNIVDYSDNYESFKTRYEEMISEMNNKKIDTSPLFAVSLKVKEEVDKV